MSSAILAILSSSGPVLFKVHARSISSLWSLTQQLDTTLCREFELGRGGIHTSHSIWFIWLSKNESDGVSMLWQSPSELIFPSCAPVICPQIELTPSASPGQAQPQPGQSCIWDIQTTYYATNWNLSQNNQDSKSKYTGREKENSQKQTGRERDLFCSKLTQTIKIQNQATVTSQAQEIFVK